jgi:hypothetical protein
MMAAVPMRSIFRLQFLGLRLGEASFQMSAPNACDSYNQNMSTLLHSSFLGARLCRFCTSD